MDSINSLKEKIAVDFKKALKERNMEEVGTLRLLNAALLSRQKEKRYKIARTEEGIAEKELQEKSELSDEEILEVILSEIKKGKEAILEFEKGKRQDLVEKETKEMEILKKYLPEQLNDEELKQIIKDAIKATEAKDLKDLGKVMGFVMPKVKGKAEGNKVAQIIKEMLSRV